MPPSGMNFSGSVPIIGGEAEAIKGMVGRAQNLAEPVVIEGKMVLGGFSKSESIAVAAACSILPFCIADAFESAHRSCASPDAEPDLNQAINAATTNAANIGAMLANKLRLAFSPAPKPPNGIAPGAGQG